MMTLDHYSIRTGPNQQVPTLLSLWFDNIGRSTVTLESPSVQNSTGATYYTMISYSIAPPTIANVTVDTSSASLDFVGGESYSVSVATTRYNYGFTISYA